MGPVVDGQDWAWVAGIVAVIGGMVLVYFLFHRADRERELLAEYHAQVAAEVSSP